MCWARQPMLVALLLLLKTITGRGDDGAAAAAQLPAGDAGRVWPASVGTADGFLRSASRQIGDAAANALAVQSSLDDMKQDLGSEYDRWQQKKKVIMGERDRILAEKAKLEAVQLEQKSLSEEKVRLEGEINMQRAASAKAETEIQAADMRWVAQNASLKKDVDLLEKQMEVIGIIKLRHENTNSQKNGDLQSRNAEVQQNIFTLNQQVFNLKDMLSHQNILTKEEHSGMMNQVELLQKNIHSLQDEVVERAQVQLEIERHWKRLSAQAEEVVKQKENLQLTRKNCEKDLFDYDKKIQAAQADFKAANAQMRQCQALDAKTQQLQGQLNECRAIERR